MIVISADLEVDVVGGACACARPAPRRARPAAPPAAPPAGSTSFRTSAARHRNTDSSEKPNRIMAVAPDSFSSRDWPVHSKPKPCGSCAGQPFHLVPARRRWAAGRGTAADAHRRVAVVAHRLHRPDHPARRREGRQRHRPAGAVQHVQFQQIFGLHAGRRVGLHHHALQPPTAREVVDVGRAERGGHRGVDGLEADAERVRLVAVDVQSAVAARLPGHPAAAR